MMTINWPWITNPSLPSKRMRRAVEMWSKSNIKTVAKGKRHFGSNEAQ